MGKQKVVMRVPMADAKMRSKALKTAVGLPGVTSAEVEGDRILVVGDGIDSIALTVMLRKRMGSAELVSVAAVEEKKGEKKGKAEGAKSVQPVIWPYPITMAQPYPYDTQERNYDQCRIM